MKCVKWNGCGSVYIHFLFALGCGHCQRMKPAYGEAAKVVNTENKVSFFFCTSVLFTIFLVFF